MCVNGAKLILECSCFKKYNSVLLLNVAALQSWFKAHSNFTNRKLPNHLTHYVITNDIDGYQNISRKENVTNSVESFNRVHSNS